LLSNACDAMENSPKKELTLDVTFRTDEVTITLSDTGPGFDSVDQDHIFSRNFSTHGSDRGYGLYHARQLVERFEGHIRAYNNDPGPGATVEIRVKTQNHG
jgi:sensor histidine kinase regulating citrate/malate metabolism